MINVKICGLKTREAVKVAIENGADFLGFVFFDKSPRNIAIEDAKPLFEYARFLSKNIKLVCVIVAPDDDLIDELKTQLNPDYLQIHGEVSLLRAKQIAQKNINTILAFGVSKKQDLENIPQYQNYCDYILFDAKPPKNHDNMGGFGVSFDWGILKDFSLSRPWFLSGGLDVSNIKQAIAATGAKNVDVSSGIESSLGIKDLEKIAAFLIAAKD